MTLLISGCCPPPPPNGNPEAAQPESACMLYLDSKGGVCVHPGEPVAGRTLLPESRG